MPMGTNAVTITVTCNTCGMDQEPILIAHRQLKSWVNGIHIQDAMSQLSPAERELLISGTCDGCFNKLFGSEPC
jgi:hypothetical protein